jgi:hypothetical protein
MLMHEGIYLLLVEVAITIYDLATPCLSCHGEQTRLRAGQSTTHTTRGQLLHVCCKHHNSSSIAIHHHNSSASLASEQVQQQQIGCQHCTLHPFNTNHLIVPRING